MSSLLLDLTMEKFFGSGTTTSSATADTKDTTSSTSSFLSSVDSIKNSSSSEGLTPPSPGRRVIFPSVYGSEELPTPMRKSCTSGSSSSSSSSPQNQQHPQMTVDPEQLPHIPPPSASTLDSKEYSPDKSKVTLCSVARAHQQQERPADLGLPGVPVATPSITGIAHNTPSFCEPVSILRASSFIASRVKEVSSVESDIPSLASSDGCVSPPNFPFPTSKPRRTISEPVCQGERNVCFDARVWVREFKRCSSERKATWYTPEEMQTFKAEAIQLILKNSETVLVPTGCGRVVQTKEPPRLLFTNKALLSDHGAEEETISKILVVDPHDICLNLFRKGLQYMIPRGQIVTTSSGEQAIRELQVHSFDMIVVEERLRLFHRQGSTHNSSGVELMKECRRCQPNALLVGVSSKNNSSVWNGVADLCWSKPPPTMDSFLLGELQHSLYEKRHSAV